MMEANTAVTTANASVVVKKDLDYPPDFNQMSYPITDVGKRGGATMTPTYRVHDTSTHNRPTFPPYDLPANYTPLIENVTNPVIVCNEGQQQQPEGTHTYAHITVEGT